MLPQLTLDVHADAWCAHLLRHDLRVIGVGVEGVLGDDLESCVANMHRRSESWFYDMQLSCVLAIREHDRFPWAMLCRTRNIDGVALFRADTLLW